MGKIHTCVGVYLNETYVVNHVAEEDLQENIKYNEFWRPGRFYFVDGKHVCGGCLKQPFQDEFVQKWEKKIEEMQLPEPVMPSIEYV
ncbi:MAG: hypothetical protein HDQ88_08295 [Clostridia bacterium]|nr:hypothetical protein [Clostridia bacterium]